MPKKLELLGYIVKKEATNISVYGDKGERVLGGNIGDAVVKDEKGEVFVMRADEYELSKPKVKKEQGALNV